MYTMKKALKNKRFGAVLAWLFALFAVIASFGIGNMTQGNSISGALHTTFHVPTHLTGIVITVLALLIIVGGIKSISKVSSVVVPLMAIFYVICGVIVIIGNISNLPAGILMIFADGIFGKSGRRRSVRNDCRFHDECNALWCGKRCIFQRSRYGICGNYGSGCNDG